jgi:tetratricopeptide (TPR) repeat protein
MLQAQALQLIRAGKLESAAELYRELIAAGLAGASDFSNLAAILLSSGEAKQAIPLLHRSLELEGGNADTWLNLGTALHASGDLPGAADACRRALRLRPRFAKAFANLGSTLQGLGNGPEALEAYDAALAIQPDYPEVLSNRGYTLLELERPDEALASIEQALRLRPTHADAHNNRGLALRELGRIEEALEAHRRALGLQPGSADVLSNIGVAEMERGAIEAAIAAFEQALSSQPHHPLAHRHLALCVNGRQRSEPLQRARASLEASGDHPERFHLHFAIGKYLLDQGDPEAIDHLFSANRLRHQQLAGRWSLPDLDQTLAQQQQLIERFANPGTPAPEQPTLLFIVGLPRCGSTLVETILSQTAGVVDLGEVPLLAKALNAADGSHEATLEQRYRRLAARHRAIEPSCRALTDKYLSNVAHCQLIAAALPGSRIVHVYRNPMDNLLSLFSNHFARGNEWTYDLDDAVATYDRYRRLMQAHEQAMPGRIFHLSYDDLSRAPEQMLPPLLEHCGLPWDDACLSPHTSRRTVHTASAVQVRQPIHAGSVGRWLRHADALSPWAERLEQLGWSTAIPPLPEPG